ncbi:MAG TPA: hypothetical protein V6C97_08500 [Oculatellaceae cyanobacterium]
MRTVAAALLLIFSTCVNPSEGRETSNPPNDPATKFTVCKGPPEDLNWSYPTRELRPWFDEARQRIVSTITNLAPIENEKFEDATCSFRLRPNGEIYEIVVISGNSATHNDVNQAVRLLKATGALPKPVKDISRRRLLLRLLHYPNFLVFIESPNPQKPTGDTE